jgi:hypothetical protein
MVVQSGRQMGLGLMQADRIETVAQISVTGFCPCIP